MQEGTSAGIGRTGSGREEHEERQRRTHLGSVTAQGKGDANRHIDGND